VIEYLQMKLNQISVNSTIQQAEKLLEEDKSVSPAVKTMFKLLIALVSVLMIRLNINSKNSSKPPSEDKNRERGSKKEKSGKKAGGQKGHVGTKLQKIEHPDKIERIKLDKRKLPKGEYRDVGYESRQVFDINITRIVTEYRAQILEDQHGRRFTAEFPAHVKCDVQYGSEAKVSAVYMSQFQLIPYQRIQDQFAEQMKLPLSAGTIFNFNQEAYKLLEDFDAIAKRELVASGLLHVDETGINVNKKGVWLHVAANDKWTYFYPHEKRGTEAMNDIGIIPNFRGVLCHDHWKPYYTYDLCMHALCNAHHLRELTQAEELDNQKWAKAMGALLSKINDDVDKAGDVLDDGVATSYREEYRNILRDGDKECPEPTRKDGQKGRLKKSKSRNLLERLRDYENDVLRFMENKIVPFTNNLGENDLRMTKVQQKISGCFRSMEGAYMFCRIRGYLLTCRKNDVSATDALRLLFQGKMPTFVTDTIKNE
jgi:transposase